MIPYFISRHLSFLFGYIWPSYYTFKMIQTFHTGTEDEEVEQKRLESLLKYWIAIALFTCAEYYLDTFIFWIPFYYDLKLVFTLWLYYSKGADILFESFLRPYFLMHEDEIDGYLGQFKNRISTYAVVKGKNFLQVAQQKMVNAYLEEQSISQLPALKWILSALSPSTQPSAAPPHTSSQEISDKETLANLERLATLERLTNLETIQTSQNVARTDEVKPTDPEVESNHQIKPIPKAKESIVKGDNAAIVQQDMQEPVLEVEEEISSKPRVPIVKKRATLSVSKPSSLITKKPVTPPLDKAKTDKSRRNSMYT